MATTKQIQKELLKLMIRLREESRELDDISRKVLYENLWDLYETRERKIREVEDG